RTRAHGCPYGRQTHVVEPRIADVDAEFFLDQLLGKVVESPHPFICECSAAQHEQHQSAHQNVHQDPPVNVRRAFELFTGPASRRARIVFFSGADTFQVRDAAAAGRAASDSGRTGQPGAQALSVMSSSVVPSGATSIAVLAGSNAAGRRCERSMPSLSMWLRRDGISGSVKLSTGLRSSRVA